MNFRRISKAVAAAPARRWTRHRRCRPATAAPRHAASSQQDTGWGFK